MTKPAGPGIGSAYTPGAPVESVTYAPVASTPAAPAAAAEASSLQSVAGPTSKWMSKPAGPGIGSAYTPGAPVESVIYTPVASTPAFDSQPGTSFIPTETTPSFAEFMSAPNSLAPAPNAADSSVSPSEKIVVLSSPIPIKKEDVPRPTRAVSGSDLAGVAATDALSATALISVLAAVFIGGAAMLLDINTITVAITDTPRTPFLTTTLMPSSVAQEAEDLSQFFYADADIPYLSPEGTGAVMSDRVFGRFV
jgi:hypothetical protein